MNIDIFISYEGLQIEAVIIGSSPATKVGLNTMLWTVVIKKDSKKVLELLEEQVSEFYETYRDSQIDTPNQSIEDAILRRR